MVSLSCSMATGWSGTLVPPSRDKSVKHWRKLGSLIFQLPAECSQSVRKFEKVSSKGVRLKCSLLFNSNEPSGDENGERVTENWEPTTERVTENRESTTYSEKRHLRTETFKRSVIQNQWAAWSFHPWFPWREGHQRWRLRDGKVPIG